MTSLTASEVAARGHAVWAEIDLGAIRHNVGVLGALAVGAEVMGVVKGYAYGHGNPAAAQAMLAGGATRLGVARVAEGLHLREAGVSAPIHVFTEPPPEAAATMIAADLIPAVYSQAFATRLSEEAVAAGREVAVHLKIDTGMHRVGVPAGEAVDAARAIAALPNIEIEGAWTHLAVADVPDHPFTRKQLDLFVDLTGQIERGGISLPCKSVANSAATMSLPESHFDMVRCGVASYGLWPGEALTGSADLRPALALRARSNMVKHVPAGDHLSYGLRYELQTSSRVVTVPAGYADGYDRRLSGKADVLVGGRRHRVSGTVCMDQFMVDVGDSEVAAGDVVTLIGSDGDERITAEELAALTGTINYEITARIPSRVPRLYIGGAE